MPPAKTHLHEEDQAPVAEVVCFGMVTPAVVMVIDALPEHNTGTQVKAVCEFLSDDATIVATLLRGWDISSGLVGTAVGNDAAGRKVSRQLKEMGVLGRVRLSRRITTPFEVNVSDRTGARTSRSIPECWPSPARGSSCGTVWRDRSSRASWRPRSTD